MEILIGADPEVFVKREGQFVSAHGLVEGTKESPQPVSLGAVQVDGMALEFNIDPVGDADGFVHNINTVMNQLADMVPDYELHVAPVAHFGSEYIAEQPEIARILGCEADYNAWDGSTNKAPDVDTPFRTAAGHVHIGFTEGADTSDASHIDMCETLIRELDFYLGLPSLLFDSDKERRALYGRAGAYRPKSYGCEYRVLSNKWLEDEAYMRWVVSAVNNAITGLMAGKLLTEEFGDIQDIINSSDVEEAAHLIDIIGLEVPNVAES